MPANINAPMMAIERLFDSTSFGAVGTVSIEPLKAVKIRVRKSTRVHLAQGEIRDDAF
jgi:hypothetical protein